MKSLRTLYLLLAPLLVLAGCHKKEDPAPTKSALLVAKPWLQTTQSLVINGYEGTQNTSTTDAYIYTFTSDGAISAKKAVGGTSGGTGTWQLTSNDSQLQITANGNTQVYQLYEVSATKLSFGISYDQATVQQQLAASGSNDVKYLVLSAGNYVFPANTPTIQPSQITSLQERLNFVPN